MRWLYLGRSCRWWSGESGQCHPGEAGVSLPGCGLWSWLGSCWEPFQMCVELWFGCWVHNSRLECPTLLLRPLVVELYFPNAEQEYCKNWEYSKNWTLDICSGHRRCFWWLELLQSLVFQPFKSLLAYRTVWELLGALRILSRRDAIKGAVQEGLNCFRTPHWLQGLRKKTVWKILGSGSFVLSSSLGQGLWEEEDGEGN